MKQFQHISVSDAAQMIAQNADTVVCDIRDANSFNQGHMSDAFHLTNQSMADLLNQVEFEQPIIVVCYHGHSSQGAAQYLISQGFEQVYSLDGGFTEWQQLQPFVHN